MSALDGLLDAYARAPRPPLPLACQRHDAVHALRARGLPTRHDEDWKYTALRALDVMPLTAETPSRTVSADDLAALGALDAAHCPQLVFIDGRLDVGLSTPKALPAGIRVWSAASAQDDALLAPLAEDAFDAVNRMFAAAGVDVDLPAGARLAAPLCVIAVQTRAGGSHLRHRVRLGAGAQAQLIVQHVALPGTPGYLVSDVTCIELQAAAQLDFVRLQSESEAAVHISQVHVAQGEGSHFAAQALITGAALSRQECAVNHLAAACTTELRAASLLRGAQHGDVHLRIAHRQPRGSSHTHVRAVVDDTAHAVFTGRVDVLPGADQTDAAMINRNLLLSAGAEVDTRPQLQIDADDVHCSHGAAVGQLDADALFYLAARGIAPQQARQMLVQGFIAQALPDLDFTPLATAVHAQLARHGLPLADLDVEGK